MVSGSQDLPIQHIHSSFATVRAPQGHVLPRVGALHILFIGCPLYFVSVLVPKKALISRSS